MSKSQNHLTFQPLEDQAGIEIVDQIERRRDILYTSGQPTPTPVDANSFYFPVGKAVEITTAELVLPRVVGVYVRDGAGGMVTEVEHLASESLPEGSYTVELTTQMKTYLEVESALEITADVSQTRIDFGDETTVRLGARSRHRKPAATITTTENPRDVMAAVEALGSALKTTSPERSYPTLRGHPPEIQLGDQLDIPPEIQRPETGIQIEVPPDLGSIYVAAPLAYYLGAELVPGSTPRLRTDSGFEYSLSPAAGYERAVERTLKQVFLLDTVTRTEGYFPVDLHERNAIEPRVDLDFAALYDAPLADRLAAYLDVPFEVVEDQIPKWRLTTYVEPQPSSLEQLPFVLDDLAVVKTPAVNQAGATGAPTAAEAQFTRNDSFVRSAAESPTSPERSYVEVDDSSSVEQAWIGDGVPIGASKLTAEAFRNRLDRETAEGDITITIVSNDSRMDEEKDVVDEVYGDRENLPFDVRVHRDLRAAELREVLKARTEFFHYIGHTEADGLKCTDGKLDLATMDETGVDAFLLNSCQSYEQGLRLIEAGAIGGITTLSEIINDEAIEIGETIARLLNAGFPLRPALTIARGESILGGQYLVVGDGGMTVSQPESRTPNLVEMIPETDGFEVKIWMYATDDAGIGSVSIPFISQNEEYFLNSGATPEISTSQEDLAQFLELEEMAVFFGDDLYWSKSLNISDIV